MEREVEAATFVTKAYDECGVSEDVMRASPARILIEMEAGGAVLGRCQLVPATSRIDGHARLQCVVAPGSASYVVHNVIEGFATEEPCADDWLTTVTSFFPLVARKGFLLTMHVRRLTGGSFCVSHAEDELRGLFADDRAARGQAATSATVRNLLRFYAEAVVEPQLYSLIQASLCLTKALAIKGKRDFCSDTELELDCLLPPCEHPVAMATFSRLLRDDRFTCPVCGDVFREADMIDSWAGHD